MDRTDSVSILDVRIDRVNVDDILAYIDKIITDELRAIITYVNIHALNLAYQTTSFREFLNSSEINFCDGHGVSLAARLLGYKALPRLTPPDWIIGMGELCARRKFSMFFLGSLPGVAEKAAACLMENIPGLNIVGCHHGYFNKQTASEENKSVLEYINQSKADILWVGFGMPLQEQWLKENWDSLNVNVALTGGAIFDYISGEIRRGPQWMTSHGFEWLSRLLIEPGRLWRRYLIGIPRFFWYLFKHHVLD